MIDGIRIKVCGLTSIVDAELADHCGADYIAFNFYPKSPRYLPLLTFEAMSTRLPDRKKVAVSVEPTLTELMAMQTVGFDFYQIHFGPEFPRASINAWSRLVGIDRLWLAPKLPPGQDVPGALLPLASHFLLDTFHAEKFGGTGETGDWEKFSRHQKAHPDHTWILSGGLNPDNIGDALRKSGARFVDVNSGVESAPGVKDREKLKRFVVRIHESQTA